MNIEILVIWDIILNCAEAETLQVKPPVLLWMKLLMNNYITNTLFL